MGEGNYADGVLWHGWENFVRGWDGTVYMEMCRWDVYEYGVRVGKNGS